MYGYGYPNQRNTALANELASDLWIERNVPGGLNSPLGATLDNMMGGNPNPTYGQAYGGGYGYGGYGGYGNGYGYQYGLINSLFIIRIFFLLCWSIKINDGQFNLFHTEEEEERATTTLFDHHCFYYLFDFWTTTHINLVPYCIRPDTPIRWNGEQKSCYGQLITFNELKLNKVSTLDLFNWNAMIETMDLYEKYLLLPNLIDGNNEIYCNCSTFSQFGRYCEYTFNNFDDEEHIFTDVIDNSFNRVILTNDEMKIDYVTCYMGIQCKNSFLCLDWRQICNGIVECDNGEDEIAELCLELEMNECNLETEFRCKNGMCIPKSFAYDASIDCLDESDEQGYDKINELRCFQHPTFECDDTNCGWRRFSCGDGQCISLSDLTIETEGAPHSCDNRRDFMYLKEMFSTNDENQCWKSMLCLTGFDYLYSNIVCNKNSIENIQQYCPSTYFFPSHSVIYSFVYFLYDQTNRTDWSKYTGPNLICYNPNFCNFTLTLTMMKKNNLTCFLANETRFTWKNFYEDVTALFSSCYFNNQASFVRNNDKTLYQCKLSNTYISKHRVKDKRQDCAFNEDEDSHINICQYNLNDHFKCLTTENECIQRTFLLDYQFDCSDGSDEFLPTGCYYTGDISCRFLRENDNTKIPYMYRFSELCNGYEFGIYFDKTTNETDETDCQHWPYGCSSRYTNCDRQWNCHNGNDEFDCRRGIANIIQKSFNCGDNEHYCIKFTNNNNNDISMTCLEKEKAGDGIIDCIGGTDERITNICTKKYPLEFDKRFYCMNSSTCITPKQVCDRKVDCPFEDDERVCPWLIKSNSSVFYCKDSQSKLAHQRCSYSDIKTECQSREDVWFCDLDVPLDNKILLDVFDDFEPYPVMIDRDLPRKIPNPSSDQISSKAIVPSVIDIDSHNWLCNRGVVLQSYLSGYKIVCLCPPAYYGDRCQYQSERLTVFLKLNPRYYFSRLTVFRFVLYLLNENNTIISHDEIVYHHCKFATKIYSAHKFVVYLLYERMTDPLVLRRYLSKRVRIDSYIITSSNVQHMSRWLFDISAPLLPVNRLVVVLDLENKALKKLKCKQIKCSVHGKCTNYANLKEKEFCLCDQGWLGDKCDLKSSSNLCNDSSCAPGSQCIILNDERKHTKCICPLGKYGPQCYINHNPCSNVICEKNKTCVPLDSRIFDYICIRADDDGVSACTDDMMTQISIDNNVTSLSVIPAIIFICAHADVEVLRQSRLLTTNVFLPTIIRFFQTCNFGLVQIFHNLTTNFYYMVVIQPLLLESVNTSVVESNLCMNISELFNATVLYEYTYLKRLKLYHQPCQININLRCFFDEYRMCFCTTDHNSECFIFDHTYSNCDHCKNDGLCIERDASKSQWSFVCLCPECFFGSTCEFTTGNYFITLDMLVGAEMERGKISLEHQPSIVKITLSLVVLIIISGLAFNTCCIITFSHKKLRQVGCGLYLLCLSIINQFGLILLGLRFVLLLITQMYVIENDSFARICCIFLEYFVRLIPAVFDWFTVCISIERAYTVLKDVNFTKVVGLRTVKLARYLIPSVVLFNTLSTLHRPFYLTLVDEPSLNGGTLGHPWCVLDFSSSSWNSYEISINIFHLITPFSLNLISVAIFLSYKVKINSTSTLHKNKNQTKSILLKKQIFKYKPLLISTLFISIFEMPRLVLTFTLACIKYKWQRHLYLVGYLISFLPLTTTLFIYVFPSPIYYKTFRSFIRQGLRKSEKSKVSNQC